MIETLKNLKYVPKRTIRLGILSMLMSGVFVLADYGMAIMLQLYTYLLGFIEKSQLNPKLLFLVQSEDQFLTILIGFIFLRGVGQFALNFLNVAFAETYIYDVRDRFLTDVYLADKKQTNLGTAANILGEVIPKSAAYLTQVARFITLLIQVIGIGAICLFTLPKEFLLTILTFSLIVPFVLVLNKKARLFSKVILCESKSLNHHLMTSIKNLLFLKILSNEEKALEQSKRHTHKYYHTFMKNNFLNSSSNSIPSTFGLSIVFLLFYYFNSKGNSSAELLSFFYMLNRFIQSTSQLVSASSGLSLNQVYFNEINNSVLKESYSQKKLQADENLPDVIFEEESKLSIKNLDFSYPNKSVFSDISLNLQNNELLLIKGHSGSGKSTFLMCLIGILQPENGSISWNNYDISKFNIKSLKAKIGYLGAEPFIVNGSIKDNLLYGVNQEVTEKDIYDCLEVADAKDFVLSSANKLDTYISEQGEGLSMGQKQRIGLARALLRKPKILVLDEVTANLDHETEKAIVQNIQKLKTKMTILIATHSSAFDDIADQKIEF